MKTTLFTAALLLATVLTGCNSKQTASEPQTEVAVTVTPIPDNAKPRLMPRDLFPAASDSLVAALGLESGVPSSVCAVLVEYQDSKLLFDSGNGIDDSRLLPTLDSLGIQPADIDYIFLTHLHGDHIGGLVRGDSAVFTNAPIYVAAKEHDAWKERSDNWQRVLAAYAGRVHFFAPGDTLPCSVQPIEAYGHTPGHTIYRIERNLIVGDLMHGVALQLSNPDVCARYDMDTDSAIISRKAVLDLARRDSLTIYGMHFPEPYMLTFK